MDISAEAIRQATENAQQSDVAAEFSVGTFAATGLPTASVDAVVAVDAIQFAPGPSVDCGRPRPHSIRTATPICRICTTKARRRFRYST